MLGKETIAILFIGDIIGDPGRRAIAQVMPKLRDQYPIDLVIGNGENSAGGVGITKKIYEELLQLGVQVVTSGNHVWDKKEFLKEVDQCSQFVRPANYPPTVPGQDRVLVEVPGKRPVGILNLMGRVFMPTLDCPFRTADRLIPELAKETPIIFVDMHGEATSEKTAMGWHLDGRVSAVVGSHTHVQTADERILPKGTAYLTDAGMTGPRNSVIGVETDKILDRFLTQIPQKFEPAKGPKQFCGAIVNIECETGKATSIHRVFEVLDE